MAETAKELGEGRRLRVAFRLRASLEYRAVAIDLVSALIGHIEGADAAFRHELTTAFGEAFNNVAIHGYRGRSDGMLEMEAEIGPGHITLHLMDQGLEVDLSAVNPPDLDALPEGGLGIFMIRSLVDEVTYRGGEPNVLSLTKRTRSCHPSIGTSRESDET